MRSTKCSVAPGILFSSQSHSISGGWEVNKNILCWSHFEDIANTDCHVETLVTPKTIAVRWQQQILLGVLRLTWCYVVGSLTGDGIV